MAALEQRVRDNRERIDALEDQYNGGGDVEWTRSVRGRLHSIEGTMAAMGVVTQQRVRILRGWHAVILTFCAVVTALAAVVSAVYVITT